MGAIFIKGQHDYAEPLTGDLHCFFALIFALDGRNPQITYDIRHTSDAETSLATSVIRAPSSDEEKDKHKFFEHKEPGILRINAMKVLN